MKDILSLGAGVQSSAVLLMSMKGDLPPIDHAIFADTGWEPQPVYDHLKWLMSISTIPIHEVQQGDLKQDALISQVRGVKSDTSRWASLPYFVRKVWTEDDYGELDTLIATRKKEKKPVDKLMATYHRIDREGSFVQDGMIRRQCTYEYKIRPIEKKFRELLGFSPQQRIRSKSPIVRHWFGISSDEKQRTRESDKKWSQNFYPLICFHKGSDKIAWGKENITRMGCYDWLRDNGYPEPPRSACIGCPFHNNGEWAEMQENRPGDFEDACQFDEAIRNCGGMRGQCFLHAERIPLREIVFNKNSSQLTLFSLDQDCAGMCGM